MSVKYSDNIKDYTNTLKRIHGGISIASSQTVNDAVDIIEHNYKNEIRKFTLRNKFTEGAIKKQHSKPQRSSGEFRPIEKINARVGMMKMKGGKEHYLKDQEEGATHRGNPQTGHKVAFPLDHARTSGKRTKPIKGPLQLQKSGRVQTLKFADGKKFGTPGDGFADKQRWAIMYKYTGLSGRGKKAALGPYDRYGWDISRKPFFFQGLVRGLGVFMAIGKRIRMLRRLNKVTVNVKATGKFERSFKAVDDKMMTHLMEKNVKKIAGVK